MSVLIISFNVRLRSTPRQLPSSEDLGMRVTRSQFERIKRKQGIKFGGIETESLRVYTTLTVSIVQN